jgi:hypothetical protein
MGAWIKEIETSESREARDWVRQFVLQARDLRAIEPRLRVHFRGEDHIPLSMAGRYEAIGNATVCEDDKGLYLVLIRPLSVILRDSGSRRYEVSRTPFPFCAEAQIGPLRLASAPADWVRQTKALLQAQGIPTGEGSAFSLAARLVRLTSMVPTLDEAHAEGTGDGSGVF